MTGGRWSLAVGLGLAVVTSGMVALTVHAAPAVIEAQVPAGTTLALGQVAQLTLRVPLRANRAPRLQWPGSRGLRLRRVRPLRQSDGRWRLAVELLALRPGVQQVVGMQVQGVDAAGGIHGYEVRVPPLQVQDVAAPRAQPAPEPLPVQVWHWPLIIGLGVAVGLVALAAWLWRRRRRQPVRGAAAQQPAPPAEPTPWAAVQARLSALEAQCEAMFAAGRGAAWVDALSDAVRAFVGHRYGFAALECTSGELLARVRRRAGRDVSVLTLADWLERCDLIKFARAQADVAQAKHLLVTARTMLEQLQRRTAPP
ncbi:MAG: hypothetical protein ACPGUV_01330 [Polyangiales bacterium]